MSHFDIYVFVLCLIVYILLTSLSAVMLTCIYRLNKRLIAIGAEDDKITTEYLKPKKTSKVWNVLDKIISAILLVALCAAFALSAYMNVTKDKAPNGIPSLKVVKSPSMSFVHEKNTDLLENGITDQIQTFDIVVTRHLPDEYELELYDIVLYETESGMTIIHRIVDIEEPNENHPGCRYFVLRGDANAYPDKIPVYYSQMKGIYQGERIPFVGSFVLFMQSPAGVMCILLVLICVIASPLLEKNIQKQKLLRLKVIGVIPASNADNPAKKPIEYETEGGDES